MLGQQRCGGQAAEHGEGGRGKSPTAVLLQSRRTASPGCRPIGWGRWRPGNVGGLDGAWSLDDEGIQRRQVGCPCTAEVIARRCHVGVVCPALRARHGAVEGTAAGKAIVHGIDRSVRDALDGTAFGRPGCGAADDRKAPLGVFRKDPWHVRTSLTHRSAGGHRLPRSTRLRESAFNLRLKRGARNSLGGCGWSHQRRRSAVRADSQGPTPSQWRSCPGAERLLRRADSLRPCDARSRLRWRSEHRHLHRAAMDHVKV